MTAPAPWKSRPVFLSSTFRDMHAERDHLREVVFPDLAEELRGRRHHLEPIDLRWGVETVSLDDERSKELLVLKVCLAEIERSRPFLLVLLGDRYGWIPPEERIAGVAREAGFAGEVEGKSVTALEIEFGSLASSDQRRRTWFYFRDPASYERMPEAVASRYRDTDPEASDRLEALKERIEKELPDRVRHYRLAWNDKTGGFKEDGLAAFGQQVREDLWRELDGETQSYVAQPTPSWQDEERWELEAFIEDRGRGFLGRKQIVRELLELALSPTAEGTEAAVVGASVTGQAGAGKSSLFAHLHRELQDEDILLLAHAAGISPRSMQVDALLRRWIGELAEFLKVDDPSIGITDAEELEATFASLLGRASLHKRVVVLLDALNQFEPTVRASHLTWWPKIWPHNARVIATSIPATASEAFQQRPGLRPVSLPPLTQIEAKTIVRAVCRRYHREIHPDVVDRLIAKAGPGGTPAAGNALWLELAVEELNLLDADDFERLETDAEGTAEERLHSLLLGTAERLPATVEQLYGWMLERTEQVVGKPLARDFANLIAVSRSGWRESDLRILLPQLIGNEWKWNDLQFATLRRAFRAHLVRRGIHGQYDFFHEQMRLAVRHRSLEEGALVRRLHSIIADHLATLGGEEQLRQTELMFHLIGTEDRLRSAFYYGSRTEPEEVAGATAALAAHVLAEPDTETRANLEWVLSLPDLEELEGAPAAVLCSRYRVDLFEALENETVLAILLQLAQRTRKTLARIVSHDPTNAGWQRDLAAAHIQVGSVLQAQGDADGALQAFRESRCIDKRLAAQDPTNARWQHSLSVSDERVGDVLQAQGDADGALQAFRESLGIRERLAAHEPTDSRWQRDLSVSRDRVGDVLQAQGDTTAALKVYRESLRIAQRLAAQDPTNAPWQQDLSLSHERVGSVLLAQGDADGALQAFRESLDIRGRLAAQDPSNAGWLRELSVGHNKVGDVLLAQGDAAGALEAYRESLGIAERLAAQDPTNAPWQRGLSVSHVHVGDVLLPQGDAAGALDAYRELQRTTERLAAQDPTNAGWQRDLAVSSARVGEVLLAQGDAAGALEAYRKSLDAFERLVAQDPTNAGWQRDLAVSHSGVGEVLLAQGDAAGALETYRESLGIAERLAAQDPTNAGWQQDLAVSHNKVGDVLIAQGDAAGALEAYRKSLGVFERLIAQDPSNAGWQRNLSASHERVGDLLRAEGDAAGALQAFRESRCIAKRLAAQDLTNAQWQHDLSVSDERVGDVLLEQGDADGALQAFRESRCIDKRLAAQDPTNPLWQRGLSISHNKVGDVLLAQGDATGALDAYRESLRIRERLVAEDPPSAGWQGDLSISHEKVGDVLLAQGDAAGALEAYRESLDVREQLVAQDPTNAVWQRDLVVSCCKLANSYEDSGEYVRARDWYGRCHETLSHMRAADMHIDPADAALLSQLDELFGSMTDPTLIGTMGDLEAAGTLYKENRELEALDVLDRILRISGDYEQDAKHLAEVIRTEPKGGEGLDYFEISQVEDEDFITIDSKKAPLVNAWAVPLLRLRCMCFSALLDISANLSDDRLCDRARSNCQITLKLFPEDPSFLVLVAQVVGALGRIPLHLELSNMAVVLAEKTGEHRGYVKSHIYTLEAYYSNAVEERFWIPMSEALTDGVADLENDAGPALEKLYRTALSNAQRMRTQVESWPELPSSPDDRENR